MWPEIELDQPQLRGLGVGLNRPHLPRPNARCTRSKVMNGIDSQPSHLQAREELASEATLIWDIHILGQPLE